MNVNMPPLFILSGQEWTWIAASYCVGCLTGGYYWVRWFTGQDIRQLGSGSVGARNVGRTSGTLGFLATLLWDGLKGALVGLAGMLAVPLVLVLALALVYSHFADHPGVAGALRGMGAVAAGLILATGIKLISALQTNVLGWRWCAALCLACLVGIVIIRLPMAYVLFGLGSVAFTLAYKRLKP